MQDFEKWHNMAQPHAYMKLVMFKSAALKNIHTGIHVKRGTGNIWPSEALSADRISHKCLSAARWLKQPEDTDIDWNLSTVYSSGETLTEESSLPPCWAPYVRITSYGAREERPCCFSRRAPVRSLPLPDLYYEKVMEGKHRQPGCLKGWLVPGSFSYVSRRL